ncbi:hypothetical protein [Methanomassiliicoccus luminyensis]|uniref:hypothetical protein n=1 Tax=Methanomassiliicoccus luminyensis TaxID=1080712 RepID=UPI00036CFBC9|nr:hypothetical protein [Methanomassiliicoccus luminyensis]
MTRYDIPFSRFALRWAVIFFLASVTGGLLVYPLAGIGAVRVTFVLGLILFSFPILIELIFSPYKLLLGDDGITMFFRLRPSKFVYYLEMEGIILDPNDKIPSLRLKGTRIAYGISPDAARELSKRIKSECSVY